MIPRIDSLALIRLPFYSLRGKLALSFDKDTAIPGTTGDTPSSGHCAVVAIIVNEEFGGQLFSAMVSGVSHWYNRVTVNGTTFFVDLTGDQFGLEIVQASIEDLYPNSRERQIHEINHGTFLRAHRLALRAGLFEIAEKLELNI